MGAGAIGTTSRARGRYDRDSTLFAMSRIPRIAHFVFGLREQVDPFHLMHYLAIETCRRIVQPETIYLHYHHLPFGVFWDEIRPHLTLVRVDLPNEVLTAEYDDQLVPAQYRYAHHADFVRLDALIEHGGLYADIDTVFIRPLPGALYDEKFVIGREPDVRDEVTGVRRPSLCNALLMAEPGSLYARTWRARMGAALNGTWSNHSGFLAQALSEELTDQVRVEPEESFFPITSTADGLDAFLGDGPVDLSHSYSIHLWAHLWWSFDRRDYSEHHAGEMSVENLQASRSPLAELVRPYLPMIDVDDARALTDGPAARS